MNNNLPDDCQGNNSNLPWNEPEALECPKCFSEMEQEDDGYDYHCTQEDCNGAIYAPDEDDYNTPVYRQDCY